MFYVHTISFTSVNYFLLRVLHFSIVRLKFYMQNVTIGRNGGAVHPGAQFAYDPRLERLQMLDEEHCEVSPLQSV